MKKIGKISYAHQQLCFAHGVQLAVIDVLYKNEKKKTVEDMDYKSDSDDQDDDCGNENGEDENVNTDDADSESESEQPDVEINSDDENENAYVVDIDDDETEHGELSEDLKPIIDKVRKIVKIFKRSAKNNEALQVYVLHEFKKELVLLLDTKTRWSSLAQMLRRFYDLRNCIKKALVDVNPKISLEEWEIELIHDIVCALEPIQIAVEALCRRDSNLITADATLVFTLKTLKEQNTNISLQLFDALIRRIQERRTDVSGVLQYLHTNTLSAINDSDCDLNTSWSEEVSDVFKAPSKNRIETLIKDIVIRLHGPNCIYPHVRNTF
jgi:hypothetical protein